MQTYFHLAPCLFFSSTDDGTLLEVNDYLCAELQSNKQDLTGNKAEILFTIPSKIFQQTHLFPLLKLHGHASEIYLTLQKRDGEQLPVLLNAERQMIDGAAVNMYAGIIVHNRKKFEEELIAARKTAEKAAYENTELLSAKKELQQHAEELDKQVYWVKKQNEELKQFNKVVTHDMQEPLRKLSLYAGMMHENSERKDQTKLVGKISQVAGQMRDVLLGLQQYVWLNEAPFHIDKIDFVSLLNLVKEKLKKDFEDVELCIECNKLEALTGDFEQLQLIMYQVLSNALRFRKEKNKAFVQVEADILQHNQFRTMEGKYKYVDFIRIRITDKGIGFNPSYASQVFELFRRLHSESGRGIGLSLCKKIVDNHHGTISIDSKINEGTTVTIDLPFIQSCETELKKDQTLRSTYE